MNAVLKRRVTGYSWQRRVEPCPCGGPAMDWFYIQRDGQDLRVDGIPVRMETQSDAMAATRALDFHAPPPGGFK